VSTHEPPSDQPLPHEPSSPGAPEGQPTLSRRERLKAEQQRLTERAEGAKQRLESARPRSPAVDSVMRAIEKDVAAGGGVLAGAVAFRIFMFMVPFVFLLVGVFGLGSSASDQDPQTLARKAGITGIAAKALSSVGDLSFGERILYVIVVGFATFLATRALVKVLRIVHALIWRTRAGKLQRPTRAVLLLLGVVVVAIVLSGLVGKIRGQSFLLGLLATIVYAAVPIALWVLVSFHMPHRDDVPWTALVPGAVVLGIGLEVMHVVTVYWIAREVESKTETYGAIGFAIALLLWAYLVGRLITTAAVVNESLWSRRQEQLEARRRRHAAAPRTAPHGPPAPPRPRTPPAERGS
jgi:uncharacterized BrkB/YihY/UPF0761 family membrane protein